MLDAVNRSCDSIIAEIEARIADGSLPDAAPLPSERELMEEFGASRTVIREAITALSHRGLLECKPRFRPIVRQAGYHSIIEATSPVIMQLLRDQKGVKNLYEARVFIERGLVRDAATHADRDDIRALKEALAANKTAIPKSDDFYRTDIAFHGALYRSVKNPVFEALGKGFSAWLAPQWDGMPRLPERNEQNYQAHKAIYEAILERDPDRAEQALVDHLENAWDQVRLTFDWSDEHD